jgi:hypothetical protein
MKKLPFYVVFVLLIGCSNATPTVRNNVSGRVLLDGKPVPEGIVTLHGPNGMTANGSIRPDGFYTIDDPPLGLCQITVEAIPDPHGVDVHGEKAGTGTRPSVAPARYAKPGNGLQIEVVAGQHKHDVLLKP